MTTKSCDHLLREQRSNCSHGRSGRTSSSPVFIKPYVTHSDLSSFNFRYKKICNNIQVSIRVHSQSNLIFFKEKGPKIPHFPSIRAPPTCTCVFTSRQMSRKKKPHTLKAATEKTKRLHSMNSYSAE